MKLWQISALVGLISAFIAHFAVLIILPGRTTSQLRATLVEQGIEPFSWAPILANPADVPTLPRLSPDLSYAICLFDVTEGPVELSAPVSAGYSSLTIYDQRMNAVFVSSLNETQDSTDRVMIVPKQTELSLADTPTVELTGEGIGLIRRFGASQDEDESALCARWTGP